MGKIKIKFSSIKPLASKVEPAVRNGLHSLGRIVKSPGFQTGFLSGISVYFLIRKYKKELAEKDALYKEKLQKHQAIIEELETKVDLSQERQERLLQIDTGLKAEMAILQEEKEELQKQIAELKREKKNEKEEE